MWRWIPVTAQRAVDRSTVIWDWFLGIRDPFSIPMACAENVLKLSPFVSSPFPSGPIAWSQCLNKLRVSGTGFGRAVPSRTQHDWRPKVLQ